MMGTNIYISDSLPGGWRREQFRFPKSKRKRIRKKWAKRPENWRTVAVPVFMHIGGHIYCNRVGYDQLMRGLEMTP